jgi:hypothetical protein
MPDPAAGLRALASVLAPGGGIGLMVYAPHGRTGVYMLQDALRLLAPPGEAPADRLDAARRTMKHLPQTAWLRHNTSLSDHLSGGDAGLYDLLLNPRDRAYSVPELHALAAGAGLEIACWVEPIRYDPMPLLPDPKLRARAARLDPVGRAALAEALAGNIACHIAYCVRAGDAPARADPFAPGAVPVCREIPGDVMARGIGADGAMVMNLDGLRVPFAVPPLAGAILSAIDGGRYRRRARRAGDQARRVRPRVAPDVPRSGADQPRPARRPGGLSRPRASARFGGPVLERRAHQLWRAQSV